MTRFIPSEEIDQHKVRQWHFGSIRNNSAQGFTAMPEMTLEPAFAQPVAAQPEPAAVEQPAPVVQLPEPQPEPVVMGYTEEELQAQLAQARAQAFEQGVAQGMQQGEQQAAQTWQERLTDYQNNVGSAAAVQLQDVVQAAQAQLQGLQQNMAGDLLQLASDIARQVVRQELRVNPQALQPVISEALDMLGAETKPAVVRLNPEDFEQLQAHLRQAVPNPQVQWLADPSVAPGGCLVESQGAQVDGSLERRWQRAVAALGLVSTWYEGAGHGQ